MEERRSLMEITALFYIGLVAVTVGLAVVIRNEAYVPGYVSGRESRIYNRQQGRNLAAEIGIYGMLTGVSACRVAIGADYWVYWQQFQLIAQGRHVSYEVGFRYVVRLMQLIFGDGTYKTIFFLFSVLTVFFFLKALHDRGEWYAASLYLLLTGGYYFSSMHSVRYYFALSIALFSAKYVLRGEYGKFVLAVLAAAFFHKSVLLVIPVYLLAAVLSKIHLKSWHYIVGTIIAASLIFGQGLYRKIIFYFYPYYEGSMFDNGSISWANVAKCSAVLILSLICFRSGIKENVRNRFYFWLNIGGLLIYTCGSFIPEVSRVGYYLIIFQIFLIPGLLRSMKKGWLKHLCTVGAFGAFACYFLLFLYKAYDDSIRLLPYMNWIFQ